MADTASSAAVILSLTGTKKAVKMSRIKRAGKGNRKEEIERQIKENDIELKNNMFFLPDDINKFKGKWALYIKKGKLVRLDKKKENKKANKK